MIDGTRTAGPLSLPDFDEYEDPEVVRKAEREEDLRDGFAGWALSGMLAGDYGVGNHDQAANVARRAYMVADAMMLARVRK